MTDNERVQILQTEVVEAVNRSRLPLGVKALVLENALLKVTAAMADVRHPHNDEPQEPPAE